MNKEATVSAVSSKTDLNPNQMLDTFKFYEEAAEKTKAHAWTQTAWILTLNTGLIAFSMNLYLEYANDPSFLIIELISTGVGIVLCVFLFYVLGELGRHIRNYWTFSNKIAADLPFLVSFIGEDNARKAKEVDYKADFPQFCKRLQYLALLFMLAHIAWALFVALM